MLPFIDVAYNDKCNINHDGTGLIVQTGLALASESTACTPAS